MNALEAYQKAQEIDPQGQNEYEKAELINLITIKNIPNSDFFDLGLRNFLESVDMIINEAHQNTKETNPQRQYLYLKEEIFKSVNILKKKYCNLDSELLHLAAEKVVQRVVDNEVSQNMQEKNPQKQYEYVKEEIFKSVNISNEKHYDLDFQVSSEVAEMLTNEGYDIIPLLTKSFKLIHRICWKNVKTDCNGNIIKGSVKEIGNSFTAKDYLTFYVYY